MYTLIIADDEYELRQALIRTVDWESIGFQVIGEAENGVEALELVEKLEPDLLLTDIKMPFLTGIELARQVRMVRPAMNIAFLSGYDDFEYAQQAIQYNIISYILKPISANELREEMLRIRDKMDQRVAELTRYSSAEMMEQFQQEQESRLFLYALLLSEGTDRSSVIWQKGMKEKAEKLGICKGETGHTCYLIQVVQFLDEKENNQTDITRINMIQTILSKYVRCITVFLNDRLVTLIAESERNIRRYMELFPKEIQQFARRYLNEMTIIGMGNLYGQMFDTPLGYMEAIEALDYAKKEEQGISFLADYEVAASREQNRMETVVDELIRVIKTEPEEGVKKFIDQVFTEQTTKNGLLSSQMMVSIYETVHNLVGKEVADHLIEETAAEDGQVNRLIKRQSKTEIMNLALGARTILSDTRRANTELICDDVRKIIEEEYSNEQLQLQEVSDRLHVSVSYLSTLIKKVSGKSFTTLLTEKRMEVAKEQLLYSPKKILEIAMDCGYSDNHYFSYSFKKYFGISPKKMRESVTNEEK
ncbi:MAG: response regulator [Lachnospiraceae bacterium]|nr:response regulator [Lachnospiraceae bacterium]